MSERRGSGAKPKLRKREIALAIGAGVLAAGGAAIVLDAHDEPDHVATMVDRTTYRVEPFESLETSGPQDVVITAGPAVSVRAEGAPDALARMEVAVENGRLTIRPRGSFGGRWSREAIPTFYVTVPALEAIALSGSGDVRADRIEGERFTASVTGSGELEIDRLAVDTARISVAGSGTATLAGTAREARVGIDGSGAMDAEDLETRTAAISVRGSGEVELTVREQADITVAGSGEVAVLGPASCSISQLGSGSASCEGPRPRD